MSATELADSAQPMNSSDDAVEELSLTMEDLELRQKTERKAMQANIMQLKKAVPKGDRKRLKEMQLQVAQMEADFEKKCTTELEEFSKRAASNKATNNIELNGDGLEDGPETGEGQGDTKKVSKAEKRREKKRQMELERDRRLAEDAELSKTRPRALEDKYLREKLSQRNLKIHEVAADGNCLFNAVSHQLKTRYNESVPMAEVRRLCADHLRRNREEFEPFLDDSEENFDRYCDRIEKDASKWGGSLELRALSKELRLHITVFQADGPNIEFGEESTGAENSKRHIHLSFHRKLISTGAHYNSAVDCAVESTE